MFLTIWVFECEQLSCLDLQPNLLAWDTIIHVKTSKINFTPIHNIIKSNDHTCCFAGADGSAAVVRNFVWQLCEEVTAALKLGKTYADACLDTVRSGFANF